MLSIDHKYFLPESLKLYLNDIVIRAAVSSIFEHSSGDIPKNIKFIELDSYYRARAAAVAVKYDTIIALREIWSIVWGAAVSGWTPLDPIERDMEPDSVWEAMDFCPAHQKGDYIFYSAVDIIPGDDRGGNQLFLACSLVHKLNEDHELLNDQSLTDFAFVSDKKDDWQGWMRSVASISISSDGEIEIEAWQPLISRVMALVSTHAR